MQTNLLCNYITYLAFVSNDNFIMDSTIVVILILSMNNGILTLCKCYKSILLTIVKFINNENNSKYHSCLLQLYSQFLLYLIDLCILPCALWQIYISSVALTRLYRTKIKPIYFDVLLKTPIKNSKSFQLLVSNIFLL